MRRYYTTTGAMISRVLGGRSGAFIVEVENITLMVDTGVKRKRPDLIRGFRQLGVASLDYLLLTHGHFDHAGNARFVREKYHTRVMIHESEASWVENGTVTLPEGTNAFTRFLIRVAGKYFIRMLQPEPCPVDIRFSKEMNLIPGKTRLRIMPAPGHTSGSVCVVVDNEVVIAGDSVFGIIPGSAFPPFADDPEQLIKSWKTMLDTGAWAFLPAHGKLIKKETLARNYLKLRDKNFSVGPA